MNSLPIIPETKHRGIRWLELWQHLLPWRCWLITRSDDGYFDGYFDGCFPTGRRAFHSTARRGLGILRQS